MKYAAIYSHRGRYPILKMCKYFGVSRSGFYNYVQRVNMTDKDEHLASIIQACQTQTNSTYGYRRVKQWIIREIGEVINHKAILRVMQSMSRRGNCLDNAPAENFFGIMKSECINRVKIRTINEAKRLIDEYIHFYNYERIQLKTKLTPYEKRCQLA